MDGDRNKNIITSIIPISEESFESSVAKSAKPTLNVGNQPLVQRKPIVFNFENCLDEEFKEGELLSERPPKEEHLIVEELMASAIENVDKNSLESRSLSGEYG